MGQGISRIFGIISKMDKLAGQGQINKIEPLHDNIIAVTFYGQQTNQSIRGTETKSLV